MARMRYLKPDLWTDTKVVVMSPWARLLFIGSWNFALCEAGHLDDDALSLKLKVLPADPIDAGGVLEEVIASGRIVRKVTPDGRTYLHIVNLSKHQKVDSRWATRCPYCTAGGTSLPETQESSGESHRGSPQEGMGGDGRDENPSSPDGEDESAEHLLLVASDGQPIRKPTFDDFWDAYPRKAGKIAARKAWDVAVKSRKTDPRLIVEAAARYRDDPNLPEEAKRPYPQKWLNGGHWEDPPCAPQFGGGGSRGQEPPPLRPDGTVNADAVLGKDNWQPNSPPPHIEPGTRAYIDWVKEAWRVHNAERAELAREKLARRSA